MKRFFLWLLGGRPMKLSFANVFRDRVNGKVVNTYSDYKGRRWLAHSRWSLFRVPITGGWRHGGWDHSR